MEQKFCYGCMKYRTKEPICEHCGFDERQLNQVHQLPIGAVLQNQYIVGRVLGQGGFGITYIGWDRLLKCPVAIKEYFPSGIIHRNIHMGYGVSFYNRQDEIGFDKHRKRFLKEAQALAQLSNIPHIVQVKNFFVENNTAYIVMEYVEGVTLKAHLQSLGKPMTISQTLQILEPVMQALEAVHNKNIVHRDISPDNIMLQPNGQAKLIDFGTVRFLDDSLRSKSTDAILKPGFAPMEQYNVRGNVGTWTDIYALCGTIYYCLTGTVPPDAPSRMESGDILPALRKRRDIPLEVTQALEKGMTMRIPDRVENVFVLRQLLRGGLEENAKKTRRKKKLWLILAAAAAVAALAAALLLGGMGKKEESSTEPDIQLPFATEGELIPEGPDLIRPEETGEPQETMPNILPTQDENRQRYFASADAGLKHTVVLYGNGTVQAVGGNDYGQCNVDDWRNIIQISTLKNHTVGLRADGTVVATGENQSGQCNVSSWENIIAVSAGEHHTVGLRNDGTVVAVGANGSGECNVSGWRDIVAVGTAYSNTVGLCADGTVIVAGSFSNGKIHGWDGMVDISVSDSHIVGLRGDGTVKAVGTNNHGQCNVSQWRNISSVAAGAGYTVGLQNDGKVVIQGINDVGQHAAGGWRDMAFIASGLEHIIGVGRDGRYYAAGSNEFGQCDLSGFVNG